MTKVYKLGLVVLALLTLTGINGSVRAQPPAHPRLETASPPAVTADVSPMLPYQGRITDPGTGDPVSDGNYAMSFRIYDVDAGGTALWSETKDVQVQGGLFSTNLGSATPFDTEIFDGRALWLGVKVGTDNEATPRQPLLPVAYALSLVPGALVTTNSPEAALSVGNNGTGPALSIWGNADVSGDLTVSGELLGGAHDHSTLYYSKSEANTRFVNVTGDTMSRDSSSPVLNVNQEGDGHGMEVTIEGSALGALETSAIVGRAVSKDGVAGLSTDNAGVVGYSENHNGVQGISDGTYPAIYAYNRGSGPAFYANGWVEITDHLNVASVGVNSGDLYAPFMRYVPITAGDLMYTGTNKIYTGDYAPGIVYIDGAQSGGAITFPLPTDYQYDTDFTLDLYLIPLTAGNSFEFWVRWVGLSEGSFTGTGPSYSKGPVAVGTPGYLHKQTFTLPGFAKASAPEIVQLVIRREPSDTNTGEVVLSSLRLAYQATR